LLGGKITGAGKLIRGDKPSYSFDGQLAKASAPDVCRMFALRCAGGPIEAQGHVELSGFTDKDLGSSAIGFVHFDWRHGSLLESSTPEGETPKALARFDRWIADARISDNGATVSASEVNQGSRRSGIDAKVTFADEPTISWTTASTTEAA